MTAEKRHSFKTGLKIETYIVWDTIPYMFLKQYFRFYDYFSLQDERSWTPCWTIKGKKLAKSMGRVDDALVHRSTADQRLYRFTDSASEILHTHCGEKVGLLHIFFCLLFRFVYQILSIFPGSNDEVVSVN